MVITAIRAAVAAHAEHAQAIKDDEDANHWFTDIIAQRRAQQAVEACGFESGSEQASRVHDIIESAAYDRVWGN